MLLDGAIPTEMPPNLRECVCVYLGFSRVAARVSGNFFPLGFGGGQVRHLVALPKARKALGFHQAAARLTVGTQPPRCFGHRFPGAEP